MIDAAPRDVGDVQEAVDTAEIHERAVVGDVLHDAVDHLAFFQTRNEFLTLAGAGLFQHGAAGDDDVAAAAIHFQIWNCCGEFISDPRSRIGRISTCERGRNATAPSRSTV